MTTGCTSLIAIALLLVSTAGTIAADQRIYHWVDENGVAHFTDTAPGGDTRGVGTIIVPELPSPRFDPDEDPFNVAAQAERMQAMREAMSRRREQRRAEQLERERIAAQQRVVHYHQPARVIPPWWYRPVHPQPPVQPERPVPYRTNVLRPPGRSSN